jgi:hypothetical protein
VLTLLGCFWAAVLVLGTSRALMSGDPDTLIAVPRRLALTLVGAAFSAAIVLVLRSRTASSTTVKAMWAIGLSMACGIVYAILVAVVFQLLAPLTGEGCAFRDACPEGYLVSKVIEYWVNYAFVFLAWTVLYLWALAADQALKAERQASAYREAARIAEIRALRYQINPHFIFNCLNSLSTLVNRGDPREADGMIGDPGDFLRAGLYSDPVADIELSDEIDNQRRYLKLEARRFGNRLIVAFEASPDIARARVPPLILQPLVENARSSTGSPGPARPCASRSSRPGPMTDASA